MLKEVFFCLNFQGFHSTHYSTNLNLTDSLNLTDTITLAHLMDITHLKRHRNAQE